MQIRDINRLHHACGRLAETEGGHRLLTDVGRWLQDVTGGGGEHAIRIASADVLRGNSSSYYAERNQSCCWYWAI